MKYTIETTQTGCIETLQIVGMTFQKEWERTDTGCSCKNKEFYEQMKDAGIDDEKAIDKVYEVFDENFSALYFIELSETNYFIGDGIISCGTILAKDLACDTVSFSNRLTQVDDQGNWSLKGVPWMSLYVGVPISREVNEKIYGALCKLRDYENTGYSPEEIERLERKKK